MLNRKPNAPKYLLEVDSDGLTSLWDYKPERLENWNSKYFVLVPVVFNDGSVGLLPEAQATALSDVLDYNWGNEELDYAQVGEGTLAMGFGESEENHIVHAYRTLGYEGGPNAKPYLDSE